MPSATTLEQVAHHAGVSRQTVSNALNAPERLRPETLRAVRAVIDELGYRPDSRARGLRTRSSSLIGYCIVPQHAGSVNTFMDEFLHALCGAVERTGRHVLVFTAPPGAAGLPVYEDLLARSAVDAFVLSETHHDDARHAWLADRDVPFVSFGRTVRDPGHDPGQPGPWVDVDGAEGTAAAVRHLAALGHDTIAFLALPDGNPIGDERLAGWRHACRQAGLPSSEDLVLRCADERAAGQLGIPALLDLAHPPTALVAANDALALASYTELAARGLRPGTDIAVTGFDDSPSARLALPGLSSVHQPVERLAERTVKLLDAAAARGVGEHHPGELFTPDLVVRASSTRPHR